MKPGAALFDDVLPAAGDAANVDAATILRAVQARAIACLPGADDWPESARDALRELRGLAGRSDASAVFEAGRLVQRIADAWPLVRFTFDDGGVERVPVAEVMRAHENQLIGLVRAEREILKSQRAEATRASKERRAAQVDEKEKKWINAARKLLDNGKDRRAIVAVLAKRKDAPHASTIRRYLREGGI